MGTDTTAPVEAEEGVFGVVRKAIENISILWDEFWGHFAKIVKRYCLSLTFFRPEIFPDGLTPAAQPLDKIIHKVFKGYFRGPLQMSL